MAMTSQTYRVGANAINDAFLKVFVGKGTWNPASIADGDEAVDTITIPGVALGDMVLGVSAAITPADLTLTGFVSAADTVTVSLANNTGAGVDIASTEFTVLVGRIAEFPA